MARPVKVGLDYFPFDVQDKTDIKLLEAEFGLQFIAVYVKLLQHIYGGNGYYMLYDRDVQLLFSKEVGLDPKQVAIFTKACIRRRIFDRKMYDKYSILTSEEIQLTYLEAKKRGNAKILDAFSLIKVTQNPINVTETQVNVAETQVNVAESTQRKEKKNKINLYNNNNKNKFINYDQPVYTSEEIQAAIKRKKDRQRKEQSQ
jgi:hypothetical protein